MAERIPPISLTAYHSDREWLTNTALKHAAKWTREGILWTPSHLRSYLDGCDPLVSSPALDFGSAFHALAEGKVLEEVVAILPAGMTRAMNTYKKEWRPAIDEKFGADFPDMSQKESEALRGCWDSLRDSPIVRDLLGQEKVAVEGTIRWEQGLKLQVRPDLELEDVVIDWKTAADPHKFLRGAYDLGYHRSAALQKQGVYEVSGRWKRFVHVVVGKSEPHDVVVYELTQRDIDLGAFENLKILAQIRTWIDTDYWESEWERSVITVGMPEYCHRASEIAAIDDEFGGSDE